MVEQIIFPIVINGTKIGGVFTTDSNLSVEEKSNFIKNTYIDSIKPIFKYLTRKRMNVLGYSYTNTKGLLSFSFLNALHTFKITDGKSGDILFKIYDNNTQDLTHEYTLIGLVKYLEFEHIRNIFSCREVSDETCLKSLVFIMMDLLSKRFLV